ncbi:SMP-30/gluconolactonase/LRE family protein [Streptomyces sp. TLI_185]|uniref:SMP-30/gluconolactonase/LRE family protein n=1 Tax=Streptomyces sp. TLI_185 TaxID=2485151 RepID=UPI000F502FBB|nr:hypothetical protein [Streptomyces sp. TLI_185]RPF32694.1 hypothetical protein EDD92_2585 [Streptomyces sp. TLI_185]
MPRLPHLAGIAATAVALGLLASAPASGDAPIVSQPRVVAHFAFDAGETPENIALEPDGSAELTFAFARQVANVTRHGGIRRRVTLPAVANPNTPIVHNAIVLGVARAHGGTLYVNYATGSSETGIWRISPDGGAPRQIAQLPADGLPNGLALDEQRGALYAADSVLGTVWRVPVTGGRSTAWARSTALAPVPSGTGFGVNGIKVHDGAVWASNTDRGTLLRIPVHRDGSAGTVGIRATGLDGIDDFAFTTRHGNTVLAALNGTSQVVVVRPDGSHSVVLTAQDGLSNPTSVAVRGRTVHVPSASYFAAVKDPNLLLAHLNHG